MRTITGYTITDSLTQKIVKTYGPGKRAVATRWADKHDNIYGAYRYRVSPIWEETEGEVETMDALLSRVVAAVAVAKAGAV
jgi:hypothetical protein